MPREYVKPQLLRGFRDFLPAQMILRQNVIRTMREIFETHGFAPLDTPALEYLETVLPATMFSAFQPLLTDKDLTPVRRRKPADARAELIRAGATMTVSLDELRRQLEIASTEDT